jgi:hypothetical protein
MDENAAPQDTPDTPTDASADEPSLHGMSAMLEKILTKLNEHFDHHAQDAAKVINQ